VRISKNGGGGGVNRLKGITDTVQDEEARSKDAGGKKGLNKAGAGELQQFVDRGNKTVVAHSVR